MDLRRLRIGEWATGVAGLVLLISLFLPWYGVPGASATGFESLSVIDIVLLLVAIAAMAVVPVTASRDSPSAPLIYQALTWIPAAIGALLAVIRLIDVPVDGVSLRSGAWLGAAAAIAVVVALLVAMRDERLSDPGAPTDATGVPLDAVPEVELLPAPPA